MTNEELKKNQEIHELRHTTPHKKVYSDAGCLRVAFDGVEMMFSGVGGDGDHKVWFTEEKRGVKRSLLSLDKIADTFLCKVTAKSVKVFLFDCSGKETVYETTTEEPQEYEVCNVTNGWKISTLK